MRHPAIALTVMIFTTAALHAGPGDTGEEAVATQAPDTNVQVEGIPLTVIIGYLQSDDETLRLAGLLLLDDVGPEAAAAVPALVALLDAGDATVRGLSAGVLSEMGGAAAAAAPKLRMLAENDPDEDVRQMAELALEDVGDAAAPDTGTIELVPIDPGADADVLDLVPDVSEPALPEAAPGVTAWLQPLRDHRASLQAINQRLNALSAQMPQDNAEARKWAQDLERAGRDLAAAVRAFKATFHGFVNSRTRAGLTEELDLSKECLEIAAAAGSALQTRTGFDLQAYHARQNLQSQAAAARLELVSILAREVDQRLEATGLVELLLTEGVAAVREESIARLRAGAEAELDRITEKELGLAFHDAGSFRAAVRAKGRQLVRRQVAKLLVKITSNEIVIELAAAPIIRWLEADLWPKLKEAFRNKGDLEFRTQRSIASLERARMRLWALPADATLDQVRATRRGATGALEATRYLVGDLNRANRADLYDQLKAEAENLARAIDISAQRFLLHKREKLEKIAPNEEIARALAELIEAMVAEIEIPAEVAEADGGGDDDGGEGEPTEEVERIEFGPLYLVHIIETATMNGPVEKDAWILYPNKPDENGVLLTADGYGGYFINKTDRYMGPYTSNYELAPVLVQLGLRGISYGRLYIDADPEIWGEGQ